MSAVFMYYHGTLDIASPSGFLVDPRDDLKSALYVTF